MSRVCITVSNSPKLPRKSALLLNSSTRNAQVAFSNSSGLQSVFEKLRFRDGLVWTVGLTVEIKLRFQIPSAGSVDGALVVG